MIADKILLLVCDCLRYDHWDKGLLATFGPSVPNWYAVSHCSDPNFASLYTGQMPDEHGVVMQEAKEAALPNTLGQIAKKNKMATLTIGDRRAPAFYWAGFDVHAFTHPRAGVAGLPEGLLPDFMRLHDRYFVALRVLDTHEPYVGAPLYPELRESNRYETEVARYKEAVRSTAETCERLMAMAGKEALVIITADHGQLLGEHGLWSHTSGMYEELLHVPFWSSRNDINPRGVYQHDSLLNYLTHGTAVSHTWPLRFQGMCGRNGRVGWMSAVRHREIKIIQNAPKDPHGFHVFDLGRDPKEENDLAAALPQAPRLRRRAQTQLLERLRSLGYT